jgi:hypothetical protein
MPVSSAVVFAGLRPTLSSAEVSWATHQIWNLLQMRIPIRSARDKDTLAMKLYRHTPAADEFRYEVRAAPP